MYPLSTNLAIPKGNPKATRKAAMTKPRALPNNAIYARDQTCLNAAEAARFILLAQDILARIAEQSGSLEVLRLTNSATEALGRALSNAGNAVIHMQNIGAKTDHTLGAHSMLRKAL